jgi:hypothetical protein
MHPRKKVKAMISRLRRLPFNHDLSMCFVITGVLAMLSYSVTQTRAQEASVPTFHWSKSLPIDSFGPAIGVLGGTEARCLVSMDQKLYAGIGYWMDSEEQNPRLPGAQILRLDSPGSDWKVDLQLDERLTKGRLAGLTRYLAISVMKTVRFDADLSGKQLPKPVEIVLAGVWDRLGELEVFSKESGSGRWISTSLGQEKGRYAEIRSFGIYRDKVTNIQRAFAGARVNGLPIGSQIYSGAFDSRVPGGIRWEPKPEVWQGDLSLLARPTKGSGRITNFAECNGKLYATVYNVIYERQDGEQPSWKPVWKYDPVAPFENGSSGFRGLTAIRNPDGDGQILLVSLEHRPGFVFRVDPRSGKGVPEINISEFLTKQLGTRAGYVIAGYNDMLPYELGDSDKHVLLMGIEAATPLLQRRFNYLNPDAHYLTRWPDGKYSLSEIIDVSQNPKPMLVSVRSLAPSPFPNDPPGTIYAAGFDANQISVHNSAWIYRGTPTSSRKER